MTAIGSSGLQYRLDPTLLSDGGEGKIYRVLGSADKKVAKIYKPGVISRELIEKLVLMLKKPPDKNVLTQVAWPLDIIFDANKQPIGFIMPELSINTELGEIYKYNPGDPKRTLPISAEQKLVIAMNICAVISAVHDAGYVFGDFNPRNIGVDKNSGKVAFLDTDSYHVTDAAKNIVHRCNVCAPGYAAPELLQRCSDHISANPGDNKAAYAKTPLPTFTKDTDNFALAIHIFKLLMNGFNPYGGIIDTISASQGSPGVGDVAVRRDSYCFKPGYKHQSAAILPLESFPQAITELLTRAFIKGKTDPKQRPSARDWYDALERYQQTLAPCPRNLLHQYDKKNKTCPYCEADDRFLGRNSSSKAPSRQLLTQKTYTPISMPVQAPAAQPPQQNPILQAPPPAPLPTPQKAPPKAPPKVKRKGKESARKTRAPAMLAFVCAVILLVGAAAWRLEWFGGAAPGAQRIEDGQQSTVPQVKEAYALAAESSDALRLGDKYSAIALAISAMQAENDMDIPYVPEAKKALTEALGIYDLSDDYRPHRMITLDSEAVALAIAPDGMSFAAMSPGKLSVFDPRSGELLHELAAMESGLADVLYIDENTIVYTAPGGLKVYDLMSKSDLWTLGEATKIAVSGDGRTIAAVNRDDNFAVVYRIPTDTFDSSGGYVDVSFGSRRMWTPINERLGDPGGAIFELSHDGTQLAASFSDGGLEIFDIADNRNSFEIFGESDYTYFEGGFHREYFAFSAADAGESLFAVIDTRRDIDTISTILPGRVGVSADENGVYMSYDGIHVTLDPVTAEQMPLWHDPKHKAAGGYLIDGSPNSPIVRIMKYESHADKVIFTYDPGYNHIAARINAAGSRVTLYSHFYFSIFDIAGRLIYEAEIPNAGEVYDQQYIRQNGESIFEVIYYDGTVHVYSGDDGTLISIYSIPEPDPSLNEEFTTKHLRIASPLNGPPVAYDIITGDLIRELEKDAYLSYVTEVGDYIITEYITPSGEKFGMVLNGKTCVTLAYIPNLCDVIGDRLIIDDKPSGTLRETRLFSTEELIKIANAATSAFNS